MSKKCPPGVICIENVSMFFIILVFIIVSYLIYLAVSKSNQVNVNNNHKIVIQDKQNGGQNGGQNGVGGVRGLFNLFPQQMLPADVLMDPYVPPLRDERYLVPEISIGGRVPINISTNRGAVDTTYRQVGILTPLNKNLQNKDSHEKILPLMGRPLFTNRDKWQYYSMSDQNNSVKLPIRVKGRNASNEYGVDKIYNRDTVFVEGYQKAFMVTEYENDTIKYLPFL
jgi:hypothetical protein